MKRDNARTPSAACWYCHGAACLPHRCPWVRRASGLQQGKGLLGHSRGAVSLVGTAWPGARILGTFSQASNRYLSIGGGAIEPSASRSDHRCGDE